MNVMKKSKAVGRKAPKAAKKVLKPSKKTKNDAGKVSRPKKLSKKELEAKQLEEKSLEFSQKVQKALTGPSRKEDVFEIFSRPRLAPIAIKMGMTASWSLDLVCGWNALQPKEVSAMKDLQAKVKPAFLMASPPCTMFSALMKLWNFKKMKKMVRISRQADADSMVNTAVDSCLVQDSNQRLFAFEHPATASSWKEHKKLVAAILTPGTYTVTYDQCAAGLRSPSGQPMKKRTRLWTNSRGIVNHFKKFQCRCQTPHKRICGSEQGHKLSVWAQAYPKKMVNHLLLGASEDM